MMGLTEAALVFLVIVLCIVVVAVFRVQRMLRTNERIADQQARSVALQERSTEAMERIAKALEDRNTA